MDDVLSKYPIVDSLGRTQQATFVNEDGLGEVAAAVNDAVTDSVDFLHVGDDTVDRIGELIDDVLDGNGVIGKGKILFVGASASTARYCR